MLFWFYLDFQVAPLFQNSLTLFEMAIIELFLAFGEFVIINILLKDCTHLVFSVFV